MIVFYTWNTFTALLTAVIPMTLASLTRSNALRFMQDLILKTRMNYVLTPFIPGFRKLASLYAFASWKKDAAHPSMLKGYNDRFTLYADIIDREALSKICYLEFGVSKGESMKWWLAQNRNLSSRFYGFDTFDGIPEDWGTRSKGSYTNNGNIPAVSDSRCEFIKGKFQDTLWHFLQKQSLHERLVLHFDADLYSSTLFCLFGLEPFLKKDDILIFDEFDITTHEFRAFMDFQSACSLPVELMGESNNYNKVVLKVM